MRRDDLRDTGYLQRHFSSSAMLNEDSGSDGGLQLTDNAVQRLQELQRESPEGPLFLRLTVEGGGCSGFQYEFSLGSSLKPEDRIFERNGVQVVSDDISLDFLKGAVVDFETDLMRSGFVVAGNPNAASSCGCGSSFVAK
ncbi:ISCA2 [Auxenochlorella protothecoides x Auxenochlorella symbiontica]